jgi:creatinine amidohydrolase/Fe(II)-dependent formamide hydrolase-like protein
MPRLKAEGVRSVSANGVLGDPTASSVEHGRELFDRMVRNLVAELNALDVGQNGRLAGVVPRREPLGAP